MSGIDLRDAPVLVTGVGGFVGAHLARALAAAGARVSGTRLESGPGAPSLDALGLARCWDAFDLRDRDAVTAVVSAAPWRAIVHLAAQSSAARSFEAPDETFAVNVTGTWNLLEAVLAHAARARVLAVSTSEVYGPGAPGSRTREDAPFAPVSPYGFSKAAADRVAAAYAEAHGLDVVRVRPFGHSGPGQTARFAIPSWARQIAAIERGAAEPVLRVGNLDVTRDLTDVRDIVAGYLALLARGARGEAYNLCRGEGARLDDVVAQMAARSRVPVRIEVDPAQLRPADIPYLVGDPSRIREACGWSAQRPLAQILDDVLEEWRARAGE